MKSTDKKRAEFTLEDFEKGLMLAGYISPKSPQEVREKEALAEYDKKNIKEKSNLYFERTVLAAEIVNELLEERTFGRIKFQKMAYLCENVASMNINDRYKKFAAGPFDSKFMHSINNEFKKQKWFEVTNVKEGNYVVPKYSRLANCENYKTYYQRYFSDYNEGIKHIIDLFRKSKTHDVELIATLFACWKEVLDENQKFSKELIYEKLYSWSKEKKKYTKTDIDNALHLMEKENITPINI
jgi:hypothetical protein